MVYLKSGEVDDGIYFWVFLENAIQGGFVRHVGLVKGWPLATDELDAVQSLFGRVVEVVEHNDIVAGNQKFKDGKGTDVARSAAQASRQRCPLSRGIRGVD